MTTVDIVVPVFNEEEDVARNIPVLRDFLMKTGFPYEWRIVIGDNGSTDRTPEVSRELEAKYPGQVAYFRASAKGKGRLIKEAWLASRADILTFMDVDLSTELEAFPALVRAIAEEGYDVSIGSRLHAESTVKRSIKRRILTRGYNVLVRILLQARFNDAQCGFKAASSAAAHRVLPVVQDLAWFFDTEFLILAQKSGYRIAEVPVAWMEDERTSVRLASTITSDLVGLIRLRLHRPWRRLAKAAKD